MKKQLLSGIAIGLILAMIPTVVLGQNNTAAVQDYVKAQATYEAAQKELQDAKDDIYWTTARRQAAESAAQAKVDAAAKALDTAKTATGMDDYTLKNAVKVETAKNAVTQAKANEQAAKDDWYVLTSRTEAEKKAADNAKAAEANLANVEKQAAYSNQLKANADAAAAAITESAAAEREKAIREKVNAEYEAKANKQKEEEAARKAQQEAYQKSKKDAQDALDKAAKEAQADYDAGNYADNIEKTMQDQKSLSEKEAALAKQQEALDDLKKNGVPVTSCNQGGFCQTTHYRPATDAEIQAAEQKVLEKTRDLNEAKASTSESKKAQEAVDKAMEESENSRKALLDAAGVNAAGKWVSDKEAQAAKEILQEQNAQAQATADAICGNEGAASMSCQQAKQSAKEQIDANNKLIQNFENAEKNEEAAYQNYTDTVDKQSSANSQTRTEQLKSEQAQKASAVSKAEAQANMRKGAFWNALATVDTTKGDNFIDKEYTGIYQRAFDDTSTYAKSLAADAGANLKTAQGNLTDKQNALANATSKANAQKNAANNELASQLDKQLAAQESKVASAEGAVVEAQKAYDNAKTPEEKAAAKAKLDEAESNLANAQLSRDEFAKYADLQKQQNQVQEEVRAADKNLAAAEEAYKAASNTPCAEKDSACLQKQADAEAAYQKALNQRNEANEKLTNVSNEAEISKDLAALNMTDDEIKALDSSLKKQQDAVKTANSQIGDAQKAVDNAQKNVDNAQAQKDIMDKVAAGTMTQAEADQAMKGFAKEQEIQSKIQEAEKKAHTDAENAQKALEAHQRQEEAAEKAKIKTEQRNLEIQQANERYELLSGQLLGNAIRDNVTNPITSATKSVTDYVSGGIKDVQTGVGDALYDAYKSITK